jgi:hypothetical protein
LRRLVGDQEAEQLPLLAVLRGGQFEGDHYVAGVALRVLGTQYCRPYLALSDPELLALQADAAESGDAAA